MLRPLIAIFLLVVLAGCTSLNHRDAAFLQRYDISSALTAKMSHHEPLTVDDVIELSHRGVPGPFIVHYLRPTYAVYKLTPGDTDRLRHNGVDEGVIHYLLATPAMFSPSSAPVWYEDDTHFYDTHPGSITW